MSRSALNILLVEDDPFARAMLEQILTEEGYRLKLAENGVEALKVFYAQDNVDLIITDMNMPEMDGLELIRRLREDKHDVPIIVLTSNLEIKTAIAAIYGGANAYLLKDENIETTFIHTIEQTWDHYQLAREKQRLLAELEEKNQELERLSFMDGLTGISNRRYFDMVFKKEWRRAQRDRTPLSLVMMDIDCFKSYNDTYGHQNGDDCLKQVAHALDAALLRGGDFIARYGGEEFVGVMAGIGIKGAVAVAERMRENVEQLAIVHDTSPVSDRVTVSAGVACAVPDDDNDPGELVQQADALLYQAKARGRNRICSSRDA